MEQVLLLKYSIINEETSKYLYIQRCHASSNFLKTPQNGKVYSKVVRSPEKVVSFG